MFLYDVYQYATKHKIAIIAIFIILILATVTGSILLIAGGFFVMNVFFSSKSKLSSLTPKTHQQYLHKISETKEEISKINNLAVLKEKLMKHDLLGFYQVFAWVNQKQSNQLMNDNDFIKQHQIYLKQEDDMGTKYMYMILMFLNHKSDENKTIIIEKINEIIILLAKYTSKYLIDEKGDDYWINGLYDTIINKLLDIIYKKKQYRTIKDIVGAGKLVLPSKILEQTLKELFPNLPKTFIMKRDKVPLIDLGVAGHIVPPLIKIYRGQIIVHIEEKYSKRDKTDLIYKTIIEFLFSIKDDIIATVPFSISNVDWIIENLIKMVEKIAEQSNSTKLSNVIYDTPNDLLNTWCIENMIPSYRNSVRDYNKG